MNGRPLCKSNKLISRGPLVVAMAETMGGMFYYYICKYPRGVDLSNQNLAWTRVARGFQIKEYWPLNDRYLVKPDGPGDKVHALVHNTNDRKKLIM